MQLVGGPGKVGLDHLEDLALNRFILHAIHMSIYCILKIFYIYY